MISAVIYARFSSHQQREESIDGQVRACREYAESKNMMVVDTYIDRAISGRTDQRPDFQRMIEDAKRKKFSVILVWKGDRIARNREDKAYYRKLLKNHKVMIKSVAEAIPDTIEGIIMESVLDGMDEYYSASLAINTKRGMKENALQAKHNGGAVPFGFALDENKKYIADPVRGPIVTEIFRQYTDGAAMSEILAWLDRRSIKRANGKPFNYQQLRFMLSNIKYTGLYVYDGIEIPDGCPALISEEVFQMAQMKTDAQKRGTTSPVDFLLTEKCFCGECGGTISGSSGKSQNGSAYYYYNCINARKKKTCDLPPYRKDDVEDFVAEVAMCVIKNPTLVEAIADAVMRYQEEKPAAMAAASLEKRLKDVELQIENAVQFVLAGRGTAAVGEKLDKLEAEKEELQKNITIEKLQDRTVTREQLLYWIQRYSEGDIKDENFKEFLLHTFINSVIIEKDKLSIVFNYRNDERKKVTFIRESDLIPLSGSTQVQLAPRVLAGSNISLYLYQGRLIAVAA